MARCGDDAPTGSTYSQYRIVLSVSNIIELDYARSNQGIAQRHAESPGQVVITSTGPSDDFGVGSLT